MLVIADGDDQDGREIFLESMKADPIIKVSIHIYMHYRKKIICSAVVNRRGVTLRSIKYAQICID